jgi:very-short-patch-repair endonuclease
MNLNEWLVTNKSNFGSDYETLFAETVLPLVPELRFDAISVQYPFRDTDRKQRYCDFVIQENDDVRIAIEIDGYDKRGTGEGMSHSDFVDWQRRQAALTSQGWYVLRFANRDVKYEPKRCAEHISLLLKRARSSSQNKGLSLEEKERLNALTNTQNNVIEHLNKETSVMKFTVTAFTTLILALVMVIVWQSGGFSSRQPQVPVQTATTQTQPPPQPVAVPVQPPLQQIAAQLPPPQPIAIQPKVAKQPLAVQQTQPKPQDTLTAPPRVAEIPRQDTKGASCDNPISWQEAGQHIGQTAAVAGPLMKVTIRENVRGNPTWVDIGAAYPNRQRLMLIVWGDQQLEFPMLKPGQMEGQRVCIIGQIDDYKGVPQMVLRVASQFNVAH